MQKILNYSLTQDLPARQKRRYRPAECMPHHYDEKHYFYWFYLPFVIIRVAIDYVDTVLDMAGMLRLEQYKKMSRRIRALRDKYISDERYCWGMSFNNLEVLSSHKEYIQDVYEALFMEESRKLRVSISLKHPGIDKDLKAFYNAVWMAWAMVAVSGAYCRLATDHNKDMIKGGLGSMFPVELKEIESILPKLMGETAGDIPIGWVIESCKKIVDEFLKIPYRGTFRVNPVEIALLTAMKREEDLINRFYNGK